MPGIEVAALRSYPPDAQTVLAVIPDAGRVLAGSGGFDGPGTLLVRAAEVVDDQAGFGADGDTGGEATVGVRAGVGLEIQAVGDFNGRVIVELDASPPPTDEAVPAVIHVHDDGTISVQPANYDAVSGRFVAFTGGFSSLIPSWMNPVDWVAGVIDYAADYLTGRTDPAACGNDQPAWARIDPPGSTVHTCLQSNVDGASGEVRAELFFKSNRTTALVLNRPSDTAYVWVENQPDWAQPLLANLTGLDRDTHLYLPGGASVSMGFTQPEIANREILVPVMTTPATIILDGVMLLLNGSGNDVVGAALAVNACLLKSADIDLTTGDFTANVNWRTLFDGTVTCVLELLSRMEDPGVALGVVNDLSDAGILVFPNDSVLQGQAIDQAVRTATRVGRTAAAVSNLGPTPTTLYDRIFDNLDRDFIATLSLSSKAALGPPTFDEIAVASPTDGPVMIVADISGSMNDSIASGVKIEVAKQAILNFIRQVEPGTPVGLWAYPTGGASCGNGASVFDVADRDPATMEAVVRSLSADGGTPTAEALLASFESMRDRGYEAGTVVLVSDGESTCDPPCEAARVLSESGFALQFLGVGFGDITEAGQGELDCIAETTDGTSVAAEDQDALQAELDAASTPSLEAELVYPTSVVAEVGTTADGNIAISVNVENTSRTRARNVVAAFRFDNPATTAGVVAPVRALGNLDPDHQASQTWLFRPPAALIGTDVPFTVTVAADNLDSPTRVSGSVRITDADASEAGALLNKNSIVILGDSYSAGEGADGYINGFDIDENRCHRSRHTYLVAAFDIPSQNILACSGAVMADLRSRNDGNNVPSQIEQLRNLSALPSGPPRTVVMTMGGNDVGFRDVILTCVFFTCSDQGMAVERAGASSGFIAQQFEDRPFAADLSSAFQDVHAELNNGIAAAGRGTIAPILVPAYPRPVPTSQRNCLNLETVDSAELSFVNRFISTLNAHVEAAVLDAHDKGVPVYFISETEDAFLPNHTVCDADPYARGADSLNGAGIDIGAILRNEFRLSSDSPAVAQVERTTQELFHPNQEGYRALTRTMIRWSLSGQARQAEGKLAALNDQIQTSVPLTGESRPQIVTTWPVSDVDLGQLSAGSRLKPGTEYPLTVTGLGAGAPLVIEVNSTPKVLVATVTDETGHAELRVRLPSDLAEGDHKLIIAGYGEDGSREIHTVAFVVQPDRWRNPLSWFALLSAAGFATALLSSRAGMAGGRQPPMSRRSHDQACS